MRPNRLLAVVLALAALVPALAAGGVACCFPKMQTAVKPVCCPAMAAHRAAPKGCCKAPAAPKPEAKGKEGAPLATAFSPVASVSPSSAVEAIQPASAVRIARLAHRANSPEDSPPDILSRNSILLI